MIIQKNIFKNFFNINNSIYLIFIRGNIKMSLYLNNDNSKFLEYFNNEIYVDKSLLIKATNDSLGKKFKI